MHGVPYSTAGTEVFSLASLRCISLTLQTMIMTMTSACLTTAVLSLRPLLMITSATPSPRRPTARRQRTARRPRRTNRSCVRTSPRSGSGRTSTPATGTAAAVTCSCGSYCPHLSAATLLTSHLLLHLLLFYRCSAVVALRLLLLLSGLVAPVGSCSIYQLLLPCYHLLAVANLASWCPHPL